MNFETFVNWAENKFDDVKINGNEVKLNSIFCEDTKNHLWVNPEKGVYHCWKTDKAGTIIQLVSIVDNCSFKEAYEKLGLNNNFGIRQLEEKLKIFDKRPNITSLPLPKFTFLIANLSSNNHYRIKAENYLNNRQMPIGNLMICIGGKYKNRIIIPYFGKNNELIYWNSRDITNKASLRYKGPGKEEVGIGKEDVLWFNSWPKEGSKVYLTEGEFDAMSLNLTGFYGAACGGKSLGNKQLELLKPYKIAIAFDNDKSGIEGLNKLSETFEYNGIQNTTFIRPPTIYKDWNQMLCDTNKNVIKAYIEQNEKKLDSWTVNGLKLYSK